MRLVAEALELDYGLPYFLDATAIPTGEAFLPWIDTALRDCSACAIFLGGSGWGPTHLWEAELALVRQRKDLDFRIVPVALPGIANTDIAKLGTGTLFKDINWADFTRGLDNHEAVEKLRAALTGQALPGDRGPDRLTPYQIRRDAARWHKSRQQDDSILYRGGQLTEANRLAAEEADILGVPDVSVFLFAAEVNQKRFWRRVAIAAICAAIVILAAAITAFYQFRIADERRRESISRQLAMLARDADGADRGLLLSVEAYRMSPTAEAMRSLFEVNSRWNEIDLMMYADTSVEALATVDNGILLAGTDDGTVQTWDVTTGLKLGELSDAGHHGRVTALYVPPKGDVVWIGREDGQIDLNKLGESGPEDGGVTVQAPGKIEPGQDRSILTIAGSPERNLVAAGSADGQVIIFNAGVKRITFPLGVDETEQLAALAFDGATLFAGDQNGRLVVMALDGSVRETIPGFDGGISLIAVQPNNTIGIVTGFGSLRTMMPSPTGFQFESSTTVPPLVSGAAYDQWRGVLALGDANGNVHLRDTFGSEVAFGTLQPHRAVVRAVTFDRSGRLVTAAADGTIAVWHLGSAENRPATAWPPLPLSPSVLRITESATVAAATDTGAAAVWSLSGNAWISVADLITKTNALGDESLMQPTADVLPSGDGFVDLSGIEIPDIAFDNAGSAIAWTTQGGGVIWQDIGKTQQPAARLLARFPTQPGGIAISSDGTRVAARDPADTVTIYETEKEASPPIKLVAAGDIRSMNFDLAGERLALGLEDGRMQLVRIRDKTTLLEAQAINGPVDGIIFDPDELRLIGHGVTSSDRAVVVLNIADPSQPRLLQMRQAGGAPTVLALSKHADYLAAGDLDGQVLLWRLSDLSFVTTVSAGGSNVTAIAFDDTADRLITVASDTGILAWNLDPSILIAHACTKVGRDFYKDEWAEVLPDDPIQRVCPVEGAE